MNRPPDIASLIRLQFLLCGMSYRPDQNPADA
jgi:hypothetical protein